MEKRVTEGSEEERRCREPLLPVDHSSPSVVLGQNQCAKEVLRSLRSECCPEVPPELRNLVKLPRVDALIWRHSEAIVAKDVTDAFKADADGCEIPRAHG